MVQSPIRMKAFLSRLCFAVVLLAMASYAYVTLQGPKGVRAWLEQETSIAEMEKVNTKLIRENGQKRDYITRLGSDPAVQDQVIHEQIKLVHPGDKVFITGPPAGKK